MCGKFHVAIKISSDDYELIHLEKFLDIYIIGRISMSLPAALGVLGTPRLSGSGGSHLDPDSIWELELFEANRFRKICNRIALEYVLLL